MTNYHHLIIGGGMTAATGVDGIREIDSTGGSYPRISKDDCRLNLSLKEARAFGDLAEDQRR
jgi:hypothetical protein